MDDDRPLFTTFKPIGEDNTAKPGANTTLIQPQGAEQSPGHHNTHGRVPPGSFWPPPPDWSPPELVALRARTRLWFEQTQACRLRAEGKLPVWFHGFISRSEAEQLLQDQPLGCFLVRFSESTVGFVLSYRGRDRCRHFVLDQLPDGRYVILGEQSAHAELAELLRHHTTAPIVPYHEFLTAPLPCTRVENEARGKPKHHESHGWGRSYLDHATGSKEHTRPAGISLLSLQEDEPRGGTQSPAGSDAARSPLSEPPAKLPEYSPVSLEPPGARPAAPVLPQPAERSAEWGSPREARSAPPSLPAKTSSRAAAQGPLSPAGSAAAPEGAYAQVHKEAAPASVSSEAKYQQLMCFHIYAEPREGSAPSPPTYCEPEEPIPFYAMARGCSPRAAPEENIYSEVALARQDPPAPHPREPKGAFSTLPPKSRPHRRLFRSLSSQDYKRRQLPAAPSADGEGRGASSPGTEGVLSPVLELDDPVYGRSTGRAQQGAATDENVYEQLPGDRP